MLDVEKQLDDIRSRIIHEDPWTSGTIDVPEHFLKLFYSEKERPQESQVVLLNKCGSNELATLAGACEPATSATFGHGNKDVLDESYRKAGKMDPTMFASPFDLQQANVIERVISKLFSGPEANNLVYAELYKLNVYDPGSFFRPHKDTPRSVKMFGSLVIVFPTAHKGGSLVLRHKGKEFTFEPPSVIPEGSNKIAYVSFFSDVDHEVLPVTEGYRVTLTYNLYHAKRTSIPHAASLEELMAFKNTIATLLDNPTFLPDGGLLGFGLNFAYPIEHDVYRNFNESITHLKGSDELTKIACTELGLRVDLMGVFSENSNILVRCTGAIDHDKVESDTTIETLLLEYGGGELIHESGTDALGVHREFTDLQLERKLVSKEIVWVSNSREYSMFKSQYMPVGDNVYYGNEAGLIAVYADVCLVVSIGPAGDRTDVDAYKGVLIADAADLDS